MDTNKMLKEVSEKNLSPCFPPLIFIWEFHVKITFKDGLTGNKAINPVVDVKWKKMENSISWMWHWLVSVHWNA
jgi:hypothetical protein